MHTDVHKNHVFVIVTLDSGRQIRRKKKVKVGTYTDRPRLYIMQTVRQSTT